MKHFYKYLSGSLLLFFLVTLLIIVNGNELKTSFYFLFNNVLNKAAPHGTCNSCHINHTSPGTQLTMVGGNANLCISCHNPSGTASTMSFTNAMKAIPGVSGNSHAWNKNAVNLLYETNLTTDPEMLLRVINDTIVCSTCHNQHLQTYPPFLRTSNTGDAMCKNCHTTRDIQRYSDNPANKGSHPVGITYNVTDPRLNAVPQNAMVLVDSKVECSSCHSVHNAVTNDGNLLRQTNNDVLCKSCHTYGDHMGMTCARCHKSHNTDKGNIFMVNNNIVTPSSGIKSVVLTAENGANSYADADATFNGICEVCHTSTNYHKHDGSGGAHNNATNCITCHPHNNGFMPSGDCTDCHNIAQDNGDGIPVGGRRAIVGEFPLANAHAHYGAVLDGASCVICHDMSAHKSGFVNLIDADNSATIYHFLKPDSLHSDPDVSNFCMSCHDSNGATRLTTPLNPFGIGNIAPNIASKFSGTLQWNESYGDFCWGTEGTLRGVNSHHDISNADQLFSGAKLECLNCHGAHIAAKSNPIADPFNLNTAWVGTSNGFCLSCHNGGTGPANPGFPVSVKGPTVALRGLESCNYGGSPWWVDYRWSNTAHGPNSKRGWGGYSGAPQYNMLCLDCHDSHGSYTETNTLGNPYIIRDVVNGTSYVDDGARYTGPWYGPPWNTYGVSRTVKITITGLNVSWGGAQGLCNVCHSNWYNASPMSHDCEGCQFCHGHGQAYGEYDFVGSNDAPCPAKKQVVSGDNNKNNRKPPLHLNKD